RDSSGVDVRADMYSLGCTLYHLLTGQPPFRGETPSEVAIQHINGIPTPLDEFRSDVPSGLQAILSRLMAKKPEDRYATPAALAEALLPFTADDERPTVAPKKAVQKKESRADSNEDLERRAGNRGKRHVLIAAGIVLLAIAGVGAVHLALSGNG